MHAGCTLARQIVHCGGFANDEGEIVPLTKTDLIAAVAAHTGSTAKDVATVLGGFEDVVVANVAKGEKVVITGFLTFDRAQRPPRRSQPPDRARPSRSRHRRAPRSPPAPRSRRS